MYWSLFAVETAGIVFLHYVGIPLYRYLLSGPGRDRPGLSLIGPALGAIVVMQACYWSKRKLRPTLRGRGPVWGHLLVFVSRLSFAFAGSLFVIVFFTRLPDTKSLPIRTRGVAAIPLCDLLLRL